MKDLLPQPDAERWKKRSRHSPLRDHAEYRRMRLHHASMEGEIRRLEQEVRGTPRSSGCLFAAGGPVLARGSAVAG